MSSGHVFVARGDMTKIVCDHVLVTTDYNLRIGKDWETLLAGPRSRRMHGRRGMAPHLEPGAQTQRHHWPVAELFRRT